MADVSILCQAKPTSDGHLSPCYWSGPMTSCVFNFQSHIFVIAGFEKIPVQTTAKVSMMTLHNVKDFLHVTVDSDNRIIY